MTLIKTGMLNAIAVSVRILALLGLNKLLAIYVGPSGYAMISQFQNFISMALTFSSGISSTGVVKYTSKYKDNELVQRTVWRTAGTLSFICTLVVSVFIAVFNKDLAVLLLKEQAYSQIFIWFSATLFLFVLNTLLMAILNGKREIVLYVLVSIVGSLVSLFITGGLAYMAGLYGALIALVINQSIVVFITILLFRKLLWFKFKYLWGKVDKKIAKGLFKYGLMAIVSAITMPLSHILVREHLIGLYGLSGAGYWDSMWRISTVYLLFITTTLNVYFLPRFSEIRNPKELSIEIFNGYKIIIPFVIVCSLSIYFLRDFIIMLLFTEEFLPMKELFFWQLTGDVFKIASWVIGVAIIAKGDFKVFIFIEVFFYGLFYILTLLLTEPYGLKGVTIAHCVNYVACLLFVLMWLKIHYAKNVEL